MTKDHKLEMLLLVPMTSIIVVKLTELIYSYRIWIKYNWLQLVIEIFLFNLVRQLNWFYKLEGSKGTIEIRVDKVGLPRLYIDSLWKGVEKKCRFVTSFGVCTFAMLLRGFCTALLITFQQYNDEPTIRDSMCCCET